MLIDQNYAAGDVPLNAKSKQLFVGLLPLLNRFESGCQQINIAWGLIAFKELPKLFGVDY